MTESEIREIVKSVLHENADMQRKQYDESVLRTIATVLTGFGIDEDERLEIRADFYHLRQWRKSTETVKRASWITIVGIITSGIAGALWLGFKSIIGK